MTPPPAEPSSVLVAAIDRAETLWDAACALLRRWHAAEPGDSAWHAGTGAAYLAWGELVDRTQQHFAGPRALDDFTAADRELLLSVTGHGTIPDAVHAAAWGMSNAVSHTFAPAWRDALAVDRHTLVHGELYPVADAPWARPGIALSPRPASLTSPSVGELPTIRVHDATRFDVTVDFTLARTLEAVAATLDGFAAIHPNEHRDEFRFPQAHNQVFPVEAADPDAQRATLLALVQEALAGGAQISMLPELSASAEDVDALHALVADCETPHLLVAGSHHTIVDGHHENVAVGLVSGHDARMEHRKATPFSDELRFRKPTKEGIRHRHRPHITVHQADRFRVALVVCKELLDGRITDALDRMGVNLVLAPAMSEKTTPFLAACSGRAARAQAVSLVVNGPLRGGDGTLVAPAVVIGQPVDGATSVGLAVPGPAPTVTVAAFPAV